MSDAVATRELRHAGGASVHAGATAEYALPVVVDLGSWATRRAPLKRGRWIAAAGTFTVAIAILVAVAGASASSLSRAACVPSVTPGKRLQGAPSQSLLSILGVLRRPVTPADVLPPAIETNVLRGGFGRDIFVRYIRRARVIAGSSYYIYPVLIARCGQLAHDGIMDLATHIDLGHGTFGSDGGGGETAAAIEQGQGVGTGPPGISGQSGTSGTIDMVIPDGVASVTLRYPAGRASGYSPKISPAFTVTTSPVNNLLIVSVPRSSGGGAIQRVTMIWRAADGHVIKTFSRL
jgi:hypothetical protein